MERRRDNPELTPMPSAVDAYALRTEITDEGFIRLVSGDTAPTPVEQPSPVQTPRTARTETVASSNISGMRTEIDENGFIRLVSGDAAPAAADVVPAAPKTEEEILREFLAPTNKSFSETIRETLSQATTNVNLPKITLPEMPKLHLTEREKRLLPRAFAVGAVGLLGVIGAAAVTVTAFDSGEASATREEPTISTPDTTEAPAATAPETTTTTEAPTTTTTMPETTTTTEAPRPVEYEPQSDGFIGTIRVPALCLEVEVYTYDESERINDIMGTGAALVDRLEPDSTPDTDCPERDRREAAKEAQGEYFVTRSERGNVQYQPIAGHEYNSNGLGPNSVYPGQPGNSVVVGHGSTESAPFTELGLLVEGDQVFFDRSDDRTYELQVAETEIVSAYSDEVYNSYFDFTHPTLGENGRTMTLGYCSDENGNTGSSAARQLVRLAEVEA